MMKIDEYPIPPRSTLVMPDERIGEYPMPPRSTLVMPDDKMFNLSKELNKIVDDINTLYKHHTCATCGRITPDLYAHTWFDKNKEHMYVGLVCGDCKDFLMGYEVVMDDETD